MPNITADIQQIITGRNFPNNPATITNLLSTSSVQALVAANRITNGKSLKKVSLIVPLFALTLKDINIAVPSVKAIANIGPNACQVDPSFPPVFNVNLKNWRKEFLS